MKSNYKKIGPFLRLLSETNTDLPVSKVRGVSTTKQLIKTKANMKDVDISDYRVVGKGQFVFTPDTSRRGEKIAIALNTDEDALVSKIYSVFEVADKNALDAEYLFLWFKRPEFDRYARFNSWGSAREVFSWDDMCEVEIPLPDIEVQKNVVAVYSELLRNQQSYAESLDDLQLICDTFITDAASNYPFQSIGSLIEQSENRNIGLTIDSVRGVSISKELIFSKANMTDVALDDYKVVQPMEFVFTPVTSRNSEKISLALNRGNDSLVSKTYVVFRVVNIEIMLPEYLFLWFKRPEFDRYARFNSWGSAREVFSWDDMKRVRVPIPPINVQESIVTMHHALESRKKLNASLFESITPLCSVLMKGVVDTLTTKSS
jgi:type I restriction enzyme S subunit